MYLVINGKSGIIRTSQVITRSGGLCLAGAVDLGEGESNGCFATPRILLTQNFGGPLPSKILEVTATAEVKHTVGIKWQVGVAPIETIVNTNSFA
jgi:hypothetical protein